MNQSPSEKPTALLPAPSGQSETEREIRLRMSRLAASFPSLAGKPGVEPWEPRLLDRWASSRKTGFPERYSARFVLNLWNPDREWSCGAFDLHIAMVAWDTAHRFAFALWAMEPWLP